VFELGFKDGLLMVVQYVKKKHINAAHASLKNWREDFHHKK
jgi:hypothetical protein